MRWLLAVLLAACSHPAPPAKPECPAPVDKPADKPAVVQEVPKPTVDDKTVIAHAEAFLSAVDHNDLAAFTATTAPSFVQVITQRTYDAKVLTGSIAGRVANKFPVRTRSCADQRVFRGPSSAVYAAECTTKFPAHDDMPAFDQSTYETVALAADDWKVVLWRPVVIGPETEREMWNDTFRVSLNFKRSANQHLIDAVKGRRPGKALDIAMGQGRNVLYLASQGWKVTGVDISDVGIKLAQDAAAKQKLKFEAVVQDVDKYDLGKDRWDLVTMIYAGDDPKLIERIKPSIKKSGLFVVEFFAKEATAGTGIGGFEPGALAKQFAGWKIVTDDVVEDIADWGLKKSKVVRFTAQKI